MVFIVHLSLHVYIMHILVQNYGIWLAKGSYKEFRIIFPYFMVHFFISILWKWIWFDLFMFLLSMASTWKSIVKDVLILTWLWYFLKIFNVNNNKVTLKIRTYIYIYLKYFLSNNVLWILVAHCLINIYLIC